MSVYREGEDRLGAEERETAAVQALGRWRDRTRTTILAFFAIAGIVPALVGYYVVQELQFEYNHGVALLMVNVAGAAVPWLVSVAIGVFVARRVVAARTPAQIDKLAAGYEIPGERLEAIAKLLRGL
jgi:hypothetical protein